MDKHNDAMDIIYYAGNARSLFEEASEEIENLNFDKAQKLMYAGDKELSSAYDAHRTILKDLADGKDVDCDIIVAHALDHLMATVTIKFMTNKLMKLYKLINDFSKAPNI